jgi:hypothetical protein
MFALIGVYGRQAHRAGRLGTFGFAAAVLGTMFLGGDLWFESFAVPWLAEGPFPQVLSSDPSILFALGATSSYLLFAIGSPSRGSSKMATRDTATRLCVSYVTNMGETRNPENPEPMTAAERMRRHRARQVGDDVPKVKPEPKPRKPQTLHEASLEELIDEVSDRLTGRMADDREIRALALRGVVHSYQTSSDRLSFVSIEPFAEE